MKPNMKENFNNLERRVRESLYSTDAEKINIELFSIKDPTLISGVGGSSVVADYASKVLNKKNNIITKSVEPRDVKYMNLSGYKNIISCSYSGNNYGVELSFLNDLKHYLLASKQSVKGDITNLTYNITDKEDSFISLSSTLIPCSILLNYFNPNEIERIISFIKEYTFDFNCDSNVFEIFTGLETSTPSKYLESTITESGIGIPVIHDKYSYCHGRSTFSTISENTAIYFNLGTEFDKLLINELQNYYKNVIVLDTKNTLESEFELLVKCMYLTKYIAEKQNKDLSRVKYNPIVKKLYKYNGEI